MPRPAPPVAFLECEAEDCHNQPRLGRRFCSRACACRTLGRRDKSGSGNPKWRGGTTSHPLYERWLDLVARCRRPTHGRYADYGGRGITVADEWLGTEGFWRFVAALGPMPNDGQRWTVDRIDNERGYEPGNVRWATYSDQARNKRRFGYEARQRNEKGQFA